ncbi:MAG: hypothetical protein WCC10_11825 [Tumebacillaceae bacterium]
MMEEKILEREQEPALSDRPPFSGRTSKLLGLFAATALAVSVGCSDSSSSNNNPAPASSNVAVGPDGQPINESDYCLDENNDGYCDDDGSSLNTNTFIWIGGIDIDHKSKKYYKSGKPDSSHTYYSPSRGVSSGTSGSTATGTPSSNTSQPPTSAKGTGQVINRSGSSSSTGSASSSSGSVSSSSGSSSSSSSSSGVSSSSGKGGVGSSSSSSSS